MAVLAGSVTPSATAAAASGAVATSRSGSSTSSTATMSVSPKIRRRVSFSDPTTKLRIYPACDEHRDKVIAWILVGVSFVVRFYRLGIPSSVVFDEVSGAGVGDERP